MKIVEIPGKIFSWKHIYPVLTLTLTVLLTTRNVIKGGSFGSWDSFGGHIALISFFSEGSRAFDMWNETSFGFFTPLNFVKLLAVITKISGDAIMVFNLTMILTMLGTAAGMYFFSYHFTKDRGASFVSAFLFTFNQWIVAKYSSGHLMHIFPYFLLPPLFFFLYMSLTSGRLRYIVLFSLIFSLYPFMRLDPLYYVLPFVMVYFLTYLISNFSRTVLKRAIKVASVSMIIFILLTLFLFLPVQKVPTMFSSVEYPIEEIELNSLGIYNDILGQTTSIYSNIFWGAGITWKNHPLLPLPIYLLSMLIVPVLAFSALVFRRDFITIYFSIMALISVFLAKGPQEPIASIYFWAYDNIPFFSGLHAPNRWLLITWFAYAFLLAITANGIFKWAEERISDLSYDVFRIFIISLAVLSVLIGSYYIFTQGYETSVFPDQETQPHLWLNDQDGNFRLATIPFSQTYAFLEDGTLEHDLGKSSYFFHKKPIINTIFGISFNDRGSDFPLFIKDKVDHREGAELGKILGIFDIKFFVLQGYPPTIPHAKGRLSYSEHDYFEKQKGLVRVFEGNYTPYRLKVADYYPPEYVKNNMLPKYNIIEVKRPPKILENSYRIPRIFAPQNRMLVAGGTDTFTKLAQIQSFNFSEWNLLFADDIAQKLGKDALRQQIIKSDVVTFVNSEPLDLAMFISNSTMIKMKSCEGGWKDDISPIIDGFLVNNRDVLFSDKSGEKAICHLDIKEDEEYEIWIRVFHSTNVGNLKVGIDGKYNSLLPKSNGDTGFKWVRLSREFMKTGTHTIGLINEASASGKINRLNGIVIVKKDEMEKALQEIQQMTGSKSVYLLDEDIHENFDISGGKVILYSKNGTEEESNIKMKTKVSLKYLEFKELQPSKWKLKVDSTTPYTLVFSNSYHPMWKAYVNGKEYSSIPSYYFINSFQINETGEHEVIIEFTGQRIQNTGLMISGLAYLVCLSYLFFEWKRGAGNQKQVDEDQHGGMNESQ